MHKAFHKYPFTYLPNTFNGLASLRVIRWKRQCLLSSPGENRVNQTAPRCS